MQRVVPETTLQVRTQTVYREQCTTQTRDVVVNHYQPVTEYRYEPELVGRWNLLAKPHYVYRPVPHTRWDVKSEVVRQPVVERHLVPVNQTVMVPVTTCRTVSQEVVQRVALCTPPPAPCVPTARACVPSTARSVPPSGGPVSMTARREPIGGVARLSAAIRRATATGPRQRVPGGRHATDQNFEFVWHLYFVICYFHAQNACWARHRI